MKIILMFLVILAVPLPAVVAVQTLEERVSGDRVIVLVATATSRNVIRISDDLSLELLELGVKEVISPVGEVALAHSGPVYMLRSYAVNEVHFQLYPYDPGKEYIISLDQRPSHMRDVFFSFADYWEKPVLADAVTVAALEKLAQSKP